MLPSINRSHSTDKPRPLLFTDRSHSSSTIADDRLDTDRSDHDDEYTDPNHPGSWVHHKDTLWGQCVQVISKRPKGWMKRFAENLDETMIHVSEKSADEKRWERFASTGWKNITLSADSITPPKIIQRKEKYSKYPDSGLRTINCTYCFRVVAQGAEFIPCERCDLIAHIGCIPNVSKFSKRQLEKSDARLSDAGIRRSFIRSSGIAKISTNSTTSSVGENSPDSKRVAISGKMSPDSPGSTFMSGSNSRRTSNNNGVPPLLTKGILAGDQEYRPQTAPAILVKDEFVAKDILWLCEFCEKEIKINQIYYEKKQERDIENYKKLLSCLRLQSFFRMVYDRIRFRKFRRGIIAFQQMIRMRKFAQLAEIDRLNQTYLYKIRFHELKIFTLDPIHSGNPMTSLGGHATTLGDAFITSSPSSSLMNHVPPFPTHKYPYLIGKLNSTKFERCLNYYLNRQQQQQQNHHQNANNSTGIQVAMNMIKQQNNLGSKSGTIKRPGKEPSHTPDSPLTDMKGNHEAGKAFHNFSPDDSNPNPGSSANTTGGISSLFPFLTKEDDEKDRDLLELIFLGGGTSINNHPHHHSLENPQYAKPYRDMQILLKGTLFLTVTVLEHHVEDITSVDQGTSHQVFANVTSTQAVINLLEHNMNDPLLSAFIQTYRYDLLLKSTGQGLKCRPSFLQKLGFNNTTNEFLEPSVMEKLCKYYLLDTYTTSKPYLLIPYSHANVTIKFTLSEVLDWPKAQVLGQSFFHPQHFIIRKKIISVHQCLQLSYILKPDDLPLPEEGGKIILQMPKNYSTLSSNYQNNRNNNRNSNSSGRTNGLSKAEKNKIPKDFQKEMIVEQARQLLSSGGVTGAAKRRGTKYDANGEMVQSIYPMITWTLFAPYKHDGQEFGYLMILNPVRPTSSAISIFSYSFFLFL